MSAGIQRGLAAIESAGLAPRRSLTPHDGCVVVQGRHSQLTKMQKLAQTRQIIDAGMETMLTNPRISKEEGTHHGCHGPSREGGPVLA